MCVSIPDFEYLKDILIGYIRTLTSHMNFQVEVWEDLLLPEGGEGIIFLVFCGGNNGIGIYTLS